jgi:hypothetical protein
MISLATQGGIVALVAGEFPVTADAYIEISWSVLKLYESDVWQAMIKTVVHSHGPWAMVLGHCAPG